MITQTWSTGDARQAHEERGSTRIWGIAITFNDMIDTRIVIHGNYGVATLGDDPMHLLSRCIGRLTL